MIIIEQEIVELLNSTLVTGRYSIGGDHTGRRIARLCLREDGSIDQSTKSMLHGGGRAGLQLIGS